jgi:hypothetical protein
MQTDASCLTIPDGQHRDQGGALDTADAELFSHDSLPGPRPKSATKNDPRSRRSELVAEPDGQGTARLSTVAEKSDQSGR